MLNLRLYAPGSSTYGPDALGKDVVPHLNYIAKALRGGAGETMQHLFPEGYFFSHVLYGLSWVEVGLRTPAESALHTQALEESGWALARLDSSQGRAPFSATLDPPYGVFYAGWSNWLRGGRLMLQAPEERDHGEVTRFQDECTALADAFDRSETPFLNAYPGQAWPVDSVVAAAALRLHDALFSPRFSATLDRWQAAARERPDPETGLLPHRVDPVTGQPWGGARGSSQSIIARFLIEVDADWGREQYTQFRHYFVRPFLGAPGVLEYPAGVNGMGDVDSGPLVAGFSASATVVEIGAAQVQGDRDVADSLLRAAEAVGLPLRWGDTKRYAFGLMPVGDAFLVWAKTSSPWVAEWEADRVSNVVRQGWRARLHGVALLMAAGLWAPAYLPRIRRRHQA